MMRRIAFLVVAAMLSALAAAPPTIVAAAEPAVTNIRAVHRHGQTFVTWTDAAAGEAGAAFRYSLYRSERPITAANLADARLCYRGVLHNSAKLYGSAFRPADRLDPTKPYAIIEEGGDPLPPAGGLAVVTADKPRSAYYAVVVTDTNHSPLGTVEPGASATTEPVDERPAPIRPIKLYDSRERKGPYINSTALSGQTNLPLHLTLHGSQGQGGGAGDYGDYYLFFGTPEMGYRDGLAGVFSVEEQRSSSNSKEGARLLLRVRDAVERPDGRGAMETYWFGYLCVPQNAEHDEPRFYPYTENQLLWITRWVADRYQVDRNRITVGGSSSGAVGSMNVGFRHPELFAAAYPSVGRVRRVPAIALTGKFDRNVGALMFDGKTQYYDRADGPQFAAEHADDLPFLGWACGRRDGYATWPEHIDMVRAMAEARHGFAFAWNNGDHGGGGRAMQPITKYYPAEKFALNRSYPAFRYSSIDSDMGDGDPQRGDLEGGINLGFDWNDVRDDEHSWSIAISNELAREPMTADVTPRRLQRFKPRPGDAVRWSTSTGDSGSAVVDKAGLVTVPRVRILPNVPTVLTLSRPAAVSDDSRKPPSN
jgi:hypothetical protein